MSANREWLDNWLKSKPKAPPDPESRPTGSSAEKEAAAKEAPAKEAPAKEAPAKEAPATDGIILANLSPVGQRRLLAILQQNPILPTLRFVAFRAEAFREKDLLDSFEAMVKRPHQRTEARYVPNRLTAGDAEAE